MKRLLQLMVAATISVTAMAIPAKPGLVTFIQPDGTEVRIRIVGDEHGHIAYSEEGLVVLNVDNRIEYATFDENGMAKASGKLVRLEKLGKSEAEKLQTPSQIQAWQKTMTILRNGRLAKLNGDIIKAEAEDPADGSEDSDDPAGDVEDNDNNESTPDDDRRVPLNFGRCESTFPVLGEQKGLVILVEYQDVEFTYGDYDYFHRMLNEEGFSDHGSLGSARDWFVLNSNGQFLPDFDVYGPVKLPYKRNFYGANDRFGNDKNAYQMVIHACDSLDSEVDFTQYDRDGDGKIDNVFVFYAGKGEHDSNVSNCVWPHSWDISYAVSDTTYVFDGVQLDHYACTCEYPSGYKRADGIGTFVHEFSHVMGLPDLYVTDYSGGFTPGEWSVLDQGPYNNDRLTPPNYSSYEKCALGWIELEPITEGVMELEDFTETNKAYVLPTERPDEFYFFENRQQHGNDAFLPYHGMLVWRIDYNKKKWDMNTVNNTTSHQHVDLIEADNKKTKGSRNGDPFPGVKNITEFTFETKPKLSSWKNKALDFDIKEIEETEDGIIRFNAVVRDNKTPDGVTSISDDNAPEVYYDLLGRRVKNPASGIYVVNGRKVVINVTNL